MHYLDYAATTPVPAQVAEVMVKVLTEDFGNPSAQYPLGRAARDLVEESRAAVAEALGAPPRQLLFTSCGTEGDNWAIRSALWQNRRVGKHIVSTAVEHSAVGFLKVPFTAASLGADLITLSGHKVGGPKGVGALYWGGKMRAPRPLLHGGGQEQGLRPGTEATAQIAGFAAAAALRRETMAADTAHMAACRAYALERTADIPGLVPVGAGDAPHILSLSLPGYPSQNIVSDLGEQGICISAGSACHKGKLSHVLTAMGLPKKVAAGTIRVSFGPQTTREDVDAFVGALRAHQKNRFPML